MSQPPMASLTNLPTDALLGVGWMYDDNTHIGISRGGLNFTPAKETRNIPYDNKMSNAEELDWDTFAGASIAGSFIQFVSKVGIYEPGNTTTSPGTNVSSLITPHESGALYSEGDYIRNLRLVFARAGGGYVQVRFFSAYVANYTIRGVDREEATIEATFEARNILSALAASPGKKPYVIELLTTFS